MSKKLLCIFILCTTLAAVICGCDKYNDSSACNNTANTSIASSKSANSEFWESSSSEVIENAGWLKRSYKGKLSDWSSSISEYGENFIFYVADGIKRCDIFSNETVTIVDESDIISLFIYNDKVYYLKSNLSICSVKIDGDNIQKIWDASFFKDYNVDFVNKFYIYKDVLYIYDSGTSILYYPLSGGETKLFLDDVSSIAFSGDSAFFIDHAQKTFSIFEKSLNTGEVKLVRGNGKFDSYNKELFDNVLSVNGELYYTKRLPSRIYKYNSDGEDSLILNIGTDDLISGLYSYQGKLYYAYSYGTDAGKLYLYNSDTETSEEIFYNANFKPVYGAKFIHNVFFFKTAINSYFYRSLPLE